MSGSLCCSQSAPFPLADCRNTTLTKTEAIQLQSPPKKDNCDMLYSGGNARLVVCAMVLSAIERYTVHVHPICESFFVSYRLLVIIAVCLESCRKSQRTAFYFTFVRLVIIHVSKQAFSR